MKSSRYRVVDSEQVCVPRAVQLHGEHQQPEIKGTCSKTLWIHAETKMQTPQDFSDLVKNARSSRYRQRSSTKVCVGLAITVNCQRPKPQLNNPTLPMPWTHAGTEILQALPEFARNARAPKYSQIISRKACARHAIMANGQRPKPELNHPILPIPWIHARTRTLQVLAEFARNAKSSKYSQILSGKACATYAITVN